MAKSVKRAGSGPGGKSGRARRSKPETVTITIKGPRRTVRVMRCVVKGKRTEIACLPCGPGKEGLCEFRRTVTIMCCDEGGRTVCKEVPGPWTATGRKCVGTAKGTFIRVADGAELVCTAHGSAALRRWCAALPDRPVRIRDL